MISLIFCHLTREKTVWNLLTIFPIRTLVVILLFCSAKQIRDWLHYRKTNLLHSLMSFHYSREEKNKINKLQMNHNHVPFLIIKIRNIVQSHVLFPLMKAVTSCGFPSCVSSRPCTVVNRKSSQCHARKLTASVAWFQRTRVQKLSIRF